MLTVYQVNEYRICVAGDPETMVHRGTYTTLERANERIKTLVAIEDLTPFDFETKLIELNVDRG